MTGSSGFLGAALVRALASEGLRVVGLDRRPGPAADLSPGESRVADLLDAGATRAVVAALVDGHPDAWTVFHLAGLAHVGACRDEPGRAFALNVAATAHLLEACRLAGVRRVVFPSTALVYRRRTGGHLDEAGETSPASVYAATKLASEALLGGYASEHGFACAVARLANVFGPGGHPDSVTTRMLRQAVCGLPLEVRSGRPVRDYVFRDDVAAGLYSLAGALHAPGLQVFNLSSGLPVSVREFGFAVCRATGRPPLVTESEPQGQAPEDSLVLSGQRMVDVVGWRPRWTLEAALRSTLREMREEGAG